MNIAIVSNGQKNHPEKFKENIKNCGYVIAVDGGIKQLRENGILPNIAIGDFDSAVDDDIFFIKNNNIPQIKHPTDKDKTDFEIAVDYAIGLNCSEITAFSATGSRIDHSLANMNLLIKTAQETLINIKAHEMKNTIHFVRENIRLKRQSGIFISILSASATVIIKKTIGLKYELSDHKLYFGSSLGISNYIDADDAEIYVKEGTAIVIESED